MPVKAECLTSLDDIEASQWNALQGTQCPFLRHEFLVALEHSGCVGGRTGWQPAYWVVRDEGGLLAALPTYLGRVRV